MFSTGNPLLTSKVNILINVLDVNEFPPEIAVPYETAVCENAKPGQVSVLFRVYKNPLHACVFSYKTVHECVYTYVCAYMYIMYVYNAYMHVIFVCVFLDHVLIKRNHMR